MRGRPAPLPRALHPLAWWAWAVGMAAAAMRTTNPLLLGLMVAVVAYVVAARRGDAPWARSFGVFVKIGLVVIAIRIALELAFGLRLPGTTLFTLPSVDLPDWAAGVSVGGPVTVEMLLNALTQGLRLAVLLACFGAANSLASPFRLLRSLPSVLYEAGVVVTVALSFTPEAVMTARRLRQARRLRGRPTGGAAALRGIGVPVLEGALDRSVALAASMDARGYGRRADRSVAARRVAAGCTAVGVLVVAVGLYGVLQGGSPGGLGLPLVGVGALVVAAGLLARGWRSPRTRYRPDPWRGPEWVTLACGVAALAGVVATGRIDPASLTLPLYPLAVPALPPLAVAGTLAGLVPAVATPPPVRADGPAPAPAGASAPPPATGPVPSPAGAPSPPAGALPATGPAPLPARPRGRPA